MPLRALAPEASVSAISPPRQAGQRRYESLNTITQLQLYVKYLGDSAALCGNTLRSRNATLLVLPALAKCSKAARSLGCGFPTESRRIPTYHDARAENIILLSWFVWQFLKRVAGLSRGKKLLHRRPVY